MNCSELLDYVSAGVDGRLEEERKREFESHIAICPVCRSEFEREHLTKKFVRAKLAHERTPEELRRNIIESISPQPGDSTDTPGVLGFLEQLIRRPFVRPAIALGFAAVLLIVGVTLFTDRGIIPPSSSKPSSDIVEEAVQHYSSFLDGRAKLQLISSNPNEIRDYFQKKVHFEVYVPNLGAYKLLGGVLCEHQGASFLNLVYKLDDKVIYFYTACSKELKAKSNIGLSAEAQSDLEKTGWYLDATRPEVSVAVWKEKDEICSVVAEMGKEELLALVKE